MSESPQVRVVLIDDHGLCRRGLGELLEHRAAEEGRRAGIVHAEAFRRLRFS